MSDKTQIISKEAKAILEDNSSASAEMSTNTVRSLQAIKAVLLAFLVGIILVIATGQTSSLEEFLTGFYSKNFETVTQTTKYLARLAYLIPLGLGVAVAFRIGLFNIGAAGQAMAGGGVAFWLATVLKVGAFGWVICLAVGILVGLLVALLIAFLKNKFNINEVITSIMFNWMLFYFILNLSAHGVKTIPDNNDLRMDWLNDFFSAFSDDAFVKASTSTNIGILFMIPLIIVLAIAYKKTKWGYKQELIGNNPNVGKYLGINSKNEIYKTMMLSGALAGLAGSIYFLGYDTNLPTTQTHEIPAWTFDGITIALLGFSSPIGVMCSASVFALFTSEVDTIVGSMKIISVMIGVMILFIAASNYRVQYGKRKGGGK